MEAGVAFQFRPAGAWKRGIGSACTQSYPSDYPMVSRPWLGSPLAGELPRRAADHVVSRCMRDAAIAAASSADAFR